MLVASCSLCKFWDESVFYSSINCCTVLCMLLFICVELQIKFCDKFLLETQNSKFQRRFPETSGNPSLHPWMTDEVLNPLLESEHLVIGISLKILHTILPWCCSLVCKYHYHWPSRKNVMSSQSLKSGKAISLFLSDWVTNAE